MNACSRHQITYSVSNDRVAGFCCSMETVPPGICTVGSIDSPSTNISWDITDLPTPKEDFPGCGSHFPWIFGGYDSLEAVKMLARHYTLKTVAM